MKPHKNNILNPKLRAFSLVEVLVSMIIGTLVFGTATAAFLFVQKQIVKYKQSTTAITTLITFKTILEKDFYDADLAIKDQKTVSLLFTSEAGNLISQDKIQNIVKQKGQISYIFEPEYVLRTINDKTDTFKVATQELTYQLSEKDVQNGIVDHCSFRIKTGDSSSDLFITHKQYAADVLMAVEEKQTNGN